MVKKSSMLTASKLADGLTKIKLTAADRVRSCCSIWQDVTEQQLDTRLNQKRAKEACKHALTLHKIDYFSIFPIFFGINKFMQMAVSGNN